MSAATLTELERQIRDGATVTPYDLACSIARHRGEARAARDVADLTNRKLRARVLELLTVAAKHSDETERESLRAEYARVMAGGDP